MKVFMARADMAPAGFQPGRFYWQRNHDTPRFPESAGYPSIPLAVLSAAASAPDYTAMAVNAVRRELTRNG